MVMRAGVMHSVFHATDWNHARESSGVLGVYELDTRISVTGMFFQANNGRHCSVATSAPPASIRSTARNPNPNSSFSDRVIIAEISYGYRNARMAMEYFILYS